MPLDLALQDAAPRSTIADAVFDELRRAILEVRLPPGTRTSEAEVAKQLGVSRQPVREAFSRLARAGYLRIQPQKATEVVRISPQAVMNALFLREALEIAVVRRAAERRDDAALDRLRGLMALQAEAQQRDDRFAFQQHDDAFHLAVADAAECSFAWRLIDEQKALMDRVRFLSLAFGQPAALEDHGRIFDAIEAGNPQAAEAAMHRHLGGITDILTRLRRDYAPYFQDESPAAPADDESHPDD